MYLAPRVVIAALGSGAGKTTISTGLMAAFVAKGLKVASAKVGPDFIDPSYHSLATSKPSCNLDPFISGPQYITELAKNASRDCDLLIIEGAMGLFDGTELQRDRDELKTDFAIGQVPLSSTAHVASLTKSPVILVVDARSISSTIAPLVKGVSKWSAEVNVAGIILNQVGSDTHESSLRNALLPLRIPVIGAIKRDPEMTLKDRHLGLVPVIENPSEIKEKISRIKNHIIGSVDLGELEAIAKSSAPLRVQSTPIQWPQGVAKVGIGYALGKAFSFNYPENLEMLTKAGAELIPFDPASDESLPENLSGLIFGGGFPEVYANELGENEPLKRAIKTLAEGGIPIWAECGGLLYLSKRLDDVEMVGAINCESSFGKKLNLGYRRVKLLNDSPLGAKDTVFLGHEFHYSTSDPAGPGTSSFGRSGMSVTGFVTPRLFASFLHLHIGTTPYIAEQFVKSAKAYLDNVE
ncbi:MAG: cobyrinate a,c-diamide synthase [Acidimicrobiales bacterium]|nr:cobyrinate a,c-diamide synthase [Acidimicrobiales bacterium]